LWPCELLKQANKKVIPAEMADIQAVTPQAPIAGRLTAAAAMAAVEEVAIE
jgi:hypothetical protein